MVFYAWDYVSFKKEDLVKGFSATVLHKALLFSLLMGKCQLTYGLKCKQKQRNKQDDFLFVGVFWKKL